MKKVSLTILLWMSLFSILLAQDYNLGVPVIQAFPKEVANAGSQNWDMVQDGQGIMYFANNDGMLTFDGTIWRVYPLPNYTIVRSLAISDQGKIFAGGQNEFGYFSTQENGDWAFQSLRHLIPKEHQNFADVWNIEITEEGVLFLSSDKLFLLQESTISVFSKGLLNYMEKVDDEIYVQDFQSGLYNFSNKTFNKIPNSEFFIGKTISNILEVGGEKRYATWKSGFYKKSENGFEKWATDADQFWSENNIKQAISISGNRLAIGSDYGGLLIMNALGQTIFHLHKGNGMLSNSVISLFEDASKNLWAGLISGVNYIHTNSPFTRIFPDQDLDGSGFVCKIHGEKIYFGTNKGLYVSDWKKHYSPLETIDFELVENSKGQVWGLNAVNNRLVMNHHLGAYSVENKKATRFYDKAGIWNFKALINDNSRYIAGSYNKVSLFEREGKTWNLLPDFTQLNESARFVEQDQKGTIWVAHPYRGIFKITPNESFTNSEVTLLGKADGLPSNLLNHLFRINNQLIFCGEQGSYTYNYATEKFEPYTIFNEIFGTETKIRRLVESKEGNIWFVTTEEFGFLKVNDQGLEKKVEKVVFPFFEKQLNQGFESIYPYDEENVFIGHDNGFIHYHPSDFLTADTTFHVVFNEIKITSPEDTVRIKKWFENNSLLKNPSNSLSSKEFSHDLNNLYFSFSATDFISGKATQYRHLLEGYESDWSAWNNLQTKEYTNLPPGNYTFHLQAKNNYQVRSNHLKYTFKISPPWYASILAILIYGILAILGIITIVNIYRKKYFGLKVNHELVVKQSEETIGKLKAEKIETELAFKQRELVSTTLNLVKKNETMAEIKDRLTEIKKQVQSSELTKQMQQLINKLKQEEIQDENWEQMMFHFNQLHRDFFGRLKLTYPELTPKDLKMCAYLRMNLSTKEMTSLLNVTTRGVEASRYRLRKKFALEKEQNLTEFLMSF